MEGDKPFRTKDLSKQIGSSRLSFAAPEDMEQYLGVTPGSATILSLCERQGTPRQAHPGQVHCRGGPLWLPSLHQYLDPEPLHAGDAGQVFAPSGHRADARRPARRAGGD
ncbi:MAG: YbaK/EbsC family protein [Evtepia sp.]